MPTSRKPSANDSLSVEIGVEGPVEDVWLDGDRRQIVVCGWWGETRVTASDATYERARLAGYRVVTDGGGNGE
jgi:hypothetical protein